MINDNKQQCNKTDVTFSGCHVIITTSEHACHATDMLFLESYSSDCFFDDLGDLRNICNRLGRDRVWVWCASVSIESISWSKSIGTTSKQWIWTCRHRVAMSRTAFMSRSGRWSIPIRAASILCFLFSQISDNSHYKKVGKRPCCNAVANVTQCQCYSMPFDVWFVMYLYE